MHSPSGGRSLRRLQEHINLHSKRRLSSSLSDSSLSLLSESGSRKAAAPGESKLPACPAHSDRNPNSMPPDDREQDRTHGSAIAAGDKVWRSALAAQDSLYCEWQGVT